MGKRELFIIITFVVAGFGIYRLTAPPASEGRSPLSGLMDDLRTEIRGNPGRAEVTHTSTIPVSDEVTELRIGRVPRGITVTGEGRTDIAYELYVSSNGPDDAEAARYADAVTVEVSDLGYALELAISYPPEGIQTTALSLRVPARLAVELDGAVSDVTVEGLTGALTGDHSAGRLEVNGAGAVDLSLLRSRAELRRVNGPATVEARGGECLIEEPAGRVVIEQNASDITITDPADAVRIDGTGGRIRVVHPAAEVRIDTRRTEVELEIDRPVPATIETAGDTLRLVLTDEVDVTIDAVAERGGRIQASEFGLEAEVSDDTSRLSHTFGAGSARVVLRNSNDDIVIRRAR